MAADWITVGRTAVSLLPREMQHGERQKLTSEVAAAFGLKRQTLVNLLAAYNFLVSVQDKDESSYAALSKLPSASVEVYARWASRDHAAALEHARYASVQGLTVREIMAAERASRIPYPEVRGAGEILLSESRDLDRAYLLRRQDVVEHWRHIGVEAPPAAYLASRPCEDPVARSFGISVIVTAASFTAFGKVRIGPQVPWPHLIGIMEVGSRELAENYRKDAKTIFARSVAASLMFPLVLVVLPDKEALEAFRSGLPPLDQWTVAMPHQEKQKPSLSGHDQRCSLHVFGDQAGGVIFCSIEHLSNIL